MSSYVTTAGLKVAGRLYPRGTRLEDGDSLVQALGQRERDRLIHQGYLRVIGLRPGLEPGRLLNEHPPLPTETKYVDETGTRVKSIKHGPKEVDLSLPAPDLARPAKEPRRQKRAPKSDAKPVGKWDKDPARLADMDLDTLNALIYDVDPEIPPFAEGEEGEARRLLSSDYKAQGQEPAAVKVSGTIDASEPGKRTTRQPSTRRRRTVTPGR